MNDALKQTFMTAASDAATGLSLIVAILALMITSAIGAWCIKEFKNLLKRR